MSGTDSGPRSSPVTLVLLRTVVLLHALIILAQPVLAGTYLSGHYDSLLVHASVGGIVITAAMVASAAALLHWTLGRGRFWPVPVALTLFLGTSVQTAVGYARELGLHLPLGVALVVVAVGFAVAVLRRSAGARRPPLWTSTRTTSPVAPAAVTAART